MEVSSDCTTRARKLPIFQGNYVSPGTFKADDLAGGCHAVRAIGRLPHASHDRGKSIANYWGYKLGIISAVAR